MNPTGFFFYSVYSVCGSVSPYLGTGTVFTNDLVFALHAFALSSVQLVQIFMYDVSKTKLNIEARQTRTNQILGADLPGCALPHLLLSFYS